MAYEDSRWATQEPTAQHLARWDQQYADGRGLRHWPNEELIRFLGRTFGHLSTISRAAVHILEVGVGNGANAWAMDHDGFVVHGIDCSPQAIARCRDLVPRGSFYEGVFGDLRGFASDAFDAVVDVQSLQHQTMQGHIEAYAEIARVLEEDGRFFTFHQGSGMTDAENMESGRLDEWTIANASGPGAVYPDNGTICMPPISVLRELLLAGGLTPVESHVVTRTYSGGRMAEFLVVEAVRT